MTIELVFRLMRRDTRHEESKTPREDLYRNVVCGVLFLCGVSMLLDRPDFPLCSALNL